MKKLLKLSVQDIIFLLLLAFSAYLAFRHIRFPLIMDEIEYPLVGKSISENLSAIYYRGEANPENLGLWHPPLYISMLGLFFLAVPFLASTARLFGVLIYLLTLIIFYFWFKRKFGRPNLVAFAIALIPYFTFSSLLPDIDTQLFPLIALVCLLLLETKNFWLGIAISFLSKLTFGPVIVISYLITNYKELLNRKRVSVLTQVFLGIFAFSIFWILLNKLFGGSFQDNLNYVKSSTNRPELTLGYFKSVMIDNIPRNLLWINPLLVLAALLSITKNKYQIFALSASAILIFLYTFIFRSYPFEFVKYLPVVLFLFIFSITLFLNNYKKFFPQIYIYFSSLFFIGLLGSLILVRTDPIFDAYYVRGFWSVITESYLNPLLIALILVPLLFLRQKRLYLVVGLLAIISSQGLIMNLRSDSQKSVTYYYGEKSMNSLIDYVKKNDLGTILAPKDIGFNAKVKYVELANDVLMEEHVLVEKADKYDIKYLISRTNDYYSVKNWPIINSTLIEKVRTINNFEVYRIFSD